MQPVLNTTQHPDLYRFLSALVEVSTTKYVETTSGQLAQPESVVIWSPEGSTGLLDSKDKLELVEKYARKLNVNVVLSAASDGELRSWGRQIGWTVMWDVPSMDCAPNAALEKYATCNNTSLEDYSTRMAS